MSRFHWQNLDDGEKKRFWTQGRCWFRLRDRGERLNQLQLEWSIPAGHCGWSVTLGGGDSGSNLGFAFAVPWLFTLYVTVENVFRMYRFGTDFDRGHDRQIGCYFHDWGFWYSIWVGTMASWSRNYPWCKPWRQGHFDFRNLLGKQTHRLEVLKEGISLEIPMPEGVYRAVARIERRTWKRPLWFAFSRVAVQVDVPKGIPFAGKGENSWDCGDDGLFGYGVEGTSLEHAIAHGVESVLVSRRRYGHASPTAIAEALSSGGVGGERR